MSERIYEIIFIGNPGGNLNTKLINRFQINDLVLETKNEADIKINLKEHISEGKNHIPGLQINGIHFPTKSLTTYLNKLAWYNYKMDETIVIKLINHLISSGDWLPFDGPADIYDKLESGKSISPEDLQSCFSFDLLETDEEL